MGKQFFYRGYLTSCNYSCGYCPFSKRKMTEEQEKRDKAALEEFICQMEEEKREHALEIVPYGEALVHEYYWEALARLSRIETEVYTGCQTNLSFPVEKMLSIYEGCSGEKRKLRLWCTFHPSMTTVEAFVRQCRKLEQAGISYCAGGVGNPGEISQLRKLREALPEHVYVWINKMDGRREKYTKEEIEAFQKIDPYFFLQLKHRKGDSSKCRKSVFWEADGSQSFCNLHASQIGRKDRRSSCKRKECNCYLAYCNRTDVEELFFFQPYPAFRIPTYPKGIFLDIDGTLVEEGKREVSDSMAEKIRWLSGKSKLYLATALPYPEAMGKCRKIADYLSGGVFASGGHILVWEGKGREKRKKKWEEIIPMEENFSLYFQGRKEIGYRSYQKENVIYKQTLFSRRKKGFWQGEAQALIREIERSVKEKGNIQIQEGKSHIGITGTGADKKTGVEKICQREGIGFEEGMAIGNGKEDIPMLSLFSRSLFLENAERKA